MSGCGKPVDLASSLQVEDVSTGWHDAGVLDGKNKLVPSITFKLKNASDQSLPVLQANALFRRATEDTEWGSGFVKVTGSDGLAPGASRSRSRSTRSWDIPARNLASRCCQQSVR